MGRVAGMGTFQILLAAGFPLGRAAFGGANALLPMKLRAASAMSALIFCAAFYVVLAWRQDDLRSRRSSDRWRASEIVSKRGVAPYV
jgi:hypothetical protein